MEMSQMETKANKRVTIMNRIIQQRYADTPQRCLRPTPIVGGAAMKKTPLSNCSIDSIFIVKFDTKLFYLVGVKKIIFRI